MRRLTFPPRPNWRQIAEEHGFFFHHVDGDLYWDESVCYAFTLKEIEQDLEDPAQELHEMCLDLTSEIVGSEELLQKLAIPSSMWDMVRDSWERNEPSLYGRFDFAYDGHGPAKLYEYNADTPTSLYEAAFFQWLWLEDAIKLGMVSSATDQFNSVQEHLIEAWQSFNIPSPMHFASVMDSEEDRATVEYMRDCAAQAGIESIQLFIEDIGIDDNGQFIDLEARPIHWLFKLYPWEHMVRDKFAPYLPQCDTTFVEPAWKMVLSNKGILPLLWERHPNHPNLLPAWFHEPATTPPVSDFVIKPLLSREGANIHVFKNYEQAFVSEGEYGDEGYIGQALCPPPFINGHGPVCGVWIANNTACGLGIREDNSPVTGNNARFVPHIISEE